MMSQQHSLLSSIKYQYQLRVSHELQIYILKSLRDLLFLALEFFIENTMVQVISTMHHVHIPLRDLGYEFLKNINSEKFAYIGYQLPVEYLAIIWILFCFINGSQGLIIIQKGARCLTIARLLRICVFSLTILPSPKPWCRFTGPVNPFRARVGGACNDLLYSGHVIIYTLTALAFTILSRQYSKKLRYSLSILIWLYILQRIICTILERHHYSIDMFLGFIVTLLIWQCKSLHIDLPTVPQNLFLHLKQLFFPKCRFTLKEV
ncbi:unnamed protein product [Adineta steineri]|uniref:Sphingomyelin synthase-like domain-containing protein n=1 Tax=Adineta steineri TaxID=433720 RepID=A0A818Y242_9BILA|nr:unnamed protein product [Adineta steineri]CAF1381726.1 unnamed protein product [Adineta steineri]CAF1384599.1 unnamed protein product [Adineta steineri]CAF1509272.1 unnamed protein product [Adineta steineri]CAF1607822.1 unnamed protein product [Adineta steineri]